MIRHRVDINLGMTAGCKELDSEGCDADGIVLLRRRSHWDRDYVWAHRLDDEQDG